MPATVAPIGNDFSPAAQIHTKADAAQAFEALLLKQLFSQMTSTVGRSGLFGKGFESDLYSDMFSSAIAESAAGSGSGLTRMIQQSMGIDDRVSGRVQEIDNITRGLRSYRAEISGKTGDPSNPLLAGIAGDLLGPRAADQWGRDGTLTANDLAADLVSEGTNGPAVFNVRDASGFQGSPKCNLFAFEMLRRTGHMVPLRARNRGWGYPGADSVSRLAADGKVGDWAKVRSGSNAGELDAAAQSGQIFLLSSSAPGDTAGHMAVVDRIHDIKRNEQGEIASIEYSGWEAGTRRASYGRRVWRLSSIPGKGRGGLDRIEVLEPSPSNGRGVYKMLGSEKPGGSVLDAPRQSSERIQGFGAAADMKLGTINRSTRD